MDRIDLRVIFIPGAVFLTMHELFPFGLLLLAIGAAIVILRAIVAVFTPI